MILPLLHSIPFTVQMEVRFSLQPVSLSHFGASILSAVLCHGELEEVTDFSILALVHDLANALHGTVHLRSLLVVLNAVLFVEAGCLNVTWLGSFPF